MNGAVGAWTHDRWSTGKEYELERVVIGETVLPQLDAGIEVSAADLVDTECEAVDQVFGLILVPVSGGRVRACRSEYCRYKDRKEQRCDSCTGFWVSSTGTSQHDRAFRKGLSYIE